MLKNPAGTAETSRHPWLYRAPVLALAGWLAVGCASSQDTLVTTTKACVGLSAAGDILRPATWPVGPVTVDANLVEPYGGEFAYAGKIIKLAGKPQRFELTMPGVPEQALGRLSEFDGDVNGNFAALGLRTSLGEVGITSGCIVDGSSDTTEVMLPGPAPAS